MPPSSLFALRLLGRPMPLPPKRLARKFKKPSMSASLTREQIEYLVAEANAKNQQRTKPWTAVPNPIPDTGIHTTPEAHPAVKHSSTSSVASHHSSSSAISSSVSVSASSSLHVPLFPATQGHPSVTIAPIVTAPSVNPQALAPAIPQTTTSNAAAPTPSRRLSGAAISLIAVASVCLLLSLVVAIKLCLRPPRRPRPVPSRPIVDPAFPEEDEIFRTKLEDSPVFGGKERLSERPNTSGLWQWTQYSAPNPNPSMLAPVSEKTQQEGSRDSQLSEGSVYPAPMQQVQNALNKAANRLSMASASIYPISPMVAPGQLVTSFTADGHSVIERVNPKVLQRSRSNTVSDRSRRDPPQAKPTRYSYGFAYDGAEVASPKLPMQSPPVPMPQGRTRVTSSYQPRTSHFPKRQQDENAKNGFGSPATIYPVSPQPTLYPDDSLSVRQVKRKPTPNKRTSRVLGRDEARGVTASPTADATAALGNLMLMDFGGTKQSALDGMGSMPSKLRCDDKPPRVPSPPPLPSLAQMGLEHENPEAYNTYRSATESIYKLY
ncbi:hypothetical protein MKEN_01223900 [Mycena kentingensis (nom. inval.)]|nr:hypothetical protein MKEN_01223900 [Mycena kentingensis (nom. inval.)]